jgi:hypothetical protein
MSRNNIGRLPNFLIVGAAKAGTTSLYYYVKQHPDVGMCKLKDPRFIFSQFASVPPKGIGEQRLEYVTRFDDYCRLFTDAADKTAVGEVCPGILYYYHEAIPQIKRLLGEPKIVIILRNPVERAFSAYTGFVRDHREFLSFEDALRQEEQRMKDGWECHWFYKQAGLYYHQVKGYLENFRHVKIYLFDDLKHDALALVQDLYEFLGVDATFIPDTDFTYNVSGVPRIRVLNKLFAKNTRSPVQRFIGGAGRWLLTEAGWAKWRETIRAKLLVKTGMQPETRRYLESVYAEDILKLQALLHRDLSHWLPKSP